MDYQEAEKNLRDAQAAYDTAVAKEAAVKKVSEAEATKYAAVNDNAANSVVTSANLQVNATETSTQQAKSRSPKTGDTAANAAGAAAALAAAGAGAALFASTRKLRCAKHVK